jgi:uncharacterized protein involved in exopolysaccharide biosynthesis/Mrp family chromosome partitioning ATPase
VKGWTTLSRLNSAVTMRVFAGTDLRAAAIEWKPELMLVDDPILNHMNHAEPDERETAGRICAGFSMRAQSLWRHKAALALAALICAAAAVAIGKSLTPKYRAVAQVYVDARERQPVDREIASRPQDDSELAMAVESQARLITSNSVLLQVIQDTDLDQDQEFAGAASTSRFETSGSRMRSGGDAPQMVALEALRRHTNVYRPERSFIVDIEVWSADPAKAALLADAISNAYVAETNKWHAMAARRAAADLSERLNELQERLRNALDALATYKTQNNLLDTGGGPGSDQQLSASAQRLAAAREATFEAQEKYDQIEASRRNPTDADALPEALQPPALVRLRAQYAGARSRYAELTSELGPLHPALRQMEIQVEDLRRAIIEEVEHSAETATNELARARDYEAGLNEALEQQKRQRVQLSEASAGLRKLEGDVEVSRGVYQSLLDRARLTGAQESLNTSRARVVSEPAMPRRAFPPAMSLLASIGFVLGALAAAAVCLAITADQLPPEAGEPRPVDPLTTTIVSPSIQPPQYQPRQEVAVTAAEKPLIARLQESEVVRMQRSVLTVGTVPDLTRIGWPTLRAGLPANTFVKSVGEMRAAVMRRPSAGAIPVLAVIGGGSQDRSIAALNVALAAARSGSRVLLIDADHATRALSNHGPGKDDSGRFGWLGIGAKAPAAIETINGISVLPLDTASDTRTSDAICKAIAEARSLGGCDLVILDGPASPWSAVDRRLLDFADGLLASLPVNRDINDAVRDIIRALGEAEPKLIGFVLNELHPAAAGGNGKQFA